MDSELRPEGVVEYARDVGPIHVQRCGAIAVEHDIDARIADLQVAGHFGESGQFGDDTLELLRLGVKLLRIRPVQSEIVAALRLPAADADRLRDGQVNAQPRHVRHFGAQPVDDLGHGELALPPRLEVDRDAAGIGRSTVSAAGARIERVDIGILHHDLRQPAHVIHHLVVGSALRGLRLNVEGIVVGIGDEALGTIT